MIMRDRNLYDLWVKYTRFCILEIDQANAGKTTVLKWVCNADVGEDPCIYNENASGKWQKYLAGLACLFVK